MRIAVVVYYYSLVLLPVLFWYNGPFVEAFLPGCPPINAAITAAVDPQRRGTLFYSTTATITTISSASSTTLLSGKKRRRRGRRTTGGSSSSSTVVSWRTTTDDDSSEDDAPFGTAAKTDDDASDDATIVGRRQRRTTSPPLLPRNPPVAATENDEPVVRTLGGGTALIFQMARQLFATSDPELPSPLPQAQTRTTPLPPPQPQSQLLLPRWHPTMGISDDNPQFRTSSPRMNHQGYAGTIWRNVRKHRPSLWRYALRTYDRMAGPPMTGTDTDTTESGTSSTPPTTASTSSLWRVERTNVHHEGALLACAKLGLWRRALEIYDDVAQQQRDRRAEDSTPITTTMSTSRATPPRGESALSRTRPPRRRGSIKNSNNPALRSASSSSLDGDVSVTENMLLSVVRACVRASSRREAGGGSGSPESAESQQQQRRAPLDAASELLRRAHDHPDDHTFPLVARHVNPVAAAYLNLGLSNEATTLLTDLLRERTRGPEGEDGADPFNVHDLQARDKASYALLVRERVSRQDWPGAIDALKTMTESGLYPATRHLNAWTEIAERQTKHRTTRSRTKKRDTYWLDSVRR